MRNNPHFNLSKNDIYGYDKTNPTFLEKLRDFIRDFFENAE